MEAEFFRVLNRFVEPLVRAGLGSPGPWPAGAIVLETTGRRTGRTFNVTLLASLVGDLVLVCTVRQRSQWVRNVAHTPRVRFWMHGRPREATAVVVGSGLGALRLGEMSPLARCLAVALAPFSQWLGIAFAILTPVTPTAPA
jgi:F420H(2)-dependent quinone reductase